MFKIAASGIAGVVVGIGLGAWLASAGNQSPMAQATIIGHMAIMAGFVGLWLGTVITQGSDHDTGHA